MFTSTWTWLKAYVAYVTLNTAHFTFQNDLHVLNNLKCIVLIQWVVLSFRSITFQKHLYTFERLWAGRVDEEGSPLCDFKGLVSFMLLLWFPGNRRVDNEEGHMVMVQLLITFRSSNQHDTHNDVRKDSVTLCDTPFSVWKHAGCLVDREVRN